MNKVRCPHCNQEIEVSEVLTHQLKEQLSVENSAIHAREIEEVKTKAQEEAGEKLAIEFKLLKEDVLEKEKKLDVARVAEINLRRDKQKLEEEKKDLDLKVQRQIDDERNKIRLKTQEEMQDQHRLKDKEKDLMIEGLKKAVDEAQRKASQGSQQTQGEALEIEFETLIKQEFPNDKISEVKKGQRGGDLIQEVWDRNGNGCGTILWEFKNTTNWTDLWIDKLKQDQRALGAETAILISEVLPKDIKTAGYKNGVWVTSSRFALVLVMGVRANLIQVSQVKKSAEGKNEKMEILYKYFSGAEFGHKMEAIAESFNAMQEEIEREKRYFSLKWARDEKNIRMLIDNTQGLRGELDSIMRKALPSTNKVEKQP